MASTGVMKRLRDIAPTPEIENSLSRFRELKGLSRAELAGRAGVTRQAIHAIETGQYLPTTAVTLQLAQALDCRIEDLFRLASKHEEIQGYFAGGDTLSDVAQRTRRVKVARVGSRFVVRPVADLGEVLNYTVPADGLLLDQPVVGQGSKATVRLLRERRIIEQEISVAGCDPSIFLLGDYLRRYKDSCSVIGWTLGSAAALEALKRGDVHIAGVHVMDPSGEPNLPYIRRHLKGTKYLVTTFAMWEEGLVLAPGNPHDVRDVADLARPDIRFINREEGAGTRLLLDQRLGAAGIPTGSVRGYETAARSHVQVGRMIAEGQADVGVGLRAVAQLFGLDFIPLQQARYDFVVPKAYVRDHPGIESFLDILTSRQFRAEIDALGGYDTREMGTVRELAEQASKDN
jgi:molybdate-binding protein/DNA-binding XRE family transcriptional regulator